MGARTERGRPRLVAVVVPARGPAGATGPGDDVTTATDESAWTEPSSSLATSGR